MSEQTNGQANGGDIGYKKPPKAYHFQKGTVPNPNGRPIGSRNHLSEAFLHDFCESWKKNGSAAIEKVLKTSPVDYVKIAAGIIPKDIDLNINVNHVVLATMPSMEEFEQELKLIEHDAGPA